MTQISNVATVAAFGWRSRSAGKQDPGAIRRPGGTALLDPIIGELGLTRPVRVHDVDFARSDGGERVADVARENDFPAIG